MPIPSIETLRRLAHLAFWPALVFALVMAFLPHPPEVPTDRMGDKFNHMLAFAVLSGLATFGFPNAPRWLVVERLSFVGALVEVVQSIPALQRQCDIRDWVADTVSIVIATWLAAAARSAIEARESRRA